MKNGPQRKGPKKRKLAEKEGPRSKEKRTGQVRGGGLKPDGGDQNAGKDKKETEGSGQRPQAQERAAPEKRGV